MFKNLLLGAVALIAFTSHAGIDDTYLAGLATAPFKQLTVAGGTYKDEATITARAETNLWLDGYKRDILVDAFAVSTARLALAGKVNRNLLEIGTGSGITTGNFAHAAYLFSNAGDTNFDNVQIHTIDDWRARSAQTVRGTIDIPARFGFGTVPAAPDKAAETDYHEALSHLVQKEFTEGLPVDTLLGRIVMGRKTSGVSATYAARVDDDHVTAPIASDFYTAGITGGVSDLDLVMTDLNAGARYGTIFVDTDPASKAEMYNTLCAAWNSLEDFGTLVIDDYSWTFGDQGGDTAYVGQGVLQFLNTQQTAIHSSYKGGVDFSLDVNVTTYKSYNGVNMGSRVVTDGASSITTSDAYPVVEIHDIWPGRGRWVTVVRRSNTSIDASLVAS